MSITTTAAAQSLLDELTMLVDDAAEFLLATPYEDRAHGQLVYRDRESQLTLYCALGYCGKKRGMTDDYMDDFFGGGYHTLFFSSDTLSELNDFETLAVRGVMHNIFNASDGGSRDADEIACLKVKCSHYIDNLRLSLRGRGVDVR